jgi:hypothetical protein
MARRQKAKKNSRKIDFSKAVKYFEPDMEYAGEIKTATWEDGAEHAYLAIEFKGVDEEFEDATLYHNASISPKSLTRTREFLEALGYEIEDDEPLDIDTDDLVGRQCMFHTYEDRYKGNDGETKKSVKADDFWPMENEGKSSKKKSSKKDEDEEDDKSSKKKRSGKKSKEVEKISKEDVEAMDRDELEELITDRELDIDPEDRKYKKDAKLLAGVLEELEEKELLEGDEEEEEEEEVEEKTSKKKRGGKKDADEEDESKGKAGSKRGSKKSKGKSKKKTWTEDEIQEMSEEELDEVVEAADLEIDLSEHRTLRKKKNAMIDALEEAELIEG